MEMSRIGRIIAYSGASVLAILLGVVLALQASKLVMAHRLEKQTDTEAQRRELTDEILDDMNTIDIGDTLADHTFRDLHRNPIELTQLIKGKTLVLFFDPDCGNCELELEALQRVVTDETDCQSFLLISAGNPWLMEELKTKYHLCSPMLYDYKGQFTYGMHIYTYPFNVIIDENRVIHDIISGPLSESDLKQIIAAES
jgi:peroxiredoxin